MGEAFEIHANAAGDVKTRAQIVAHLETIARQFKQGDFGIPIETHAGIPEGVGGMQRLKEHITYVFEPTASGGRLMITAHEGDALAAVHEFFRYQIREHRTGDR